MMIGGLGGGVVLVVVDGEDGAEVGHVDDGGSFEDLLREDEVAENLRRERTAA